MAVWFFGDGARLWPAYSNCVVLETGNDGYAKTWFYNTAPILIPIPAEHIAMVEYFCSLNEKGLLYTLKSYDEAQDVYWVELSHTDTDRIPVTCIFQFGYLCAMMLKRAQQKFDTEWTFPFYRADRPSIQEKPTPMPQKAIDGECENGQHFYILVRNTDLRFDFHSLMEEFCYHYNDIENEEIGAYAEMCSGGHYYTQGDPYIYPYLRYYQVPVFTIGSYTKMFPSMLFEFGALFYRFEERMEKEVYEKRPILPPIDEDLSPLQKAKEEVDFWWGREGSHNYRYENYEIRKALKKHKELLFASELSKYKDLNRPLLIREQMELDIIRKMDKFVDREEANTFLEELKTMPMDEILRKHLNHLCIIQLYNLRWQNMAGIETPPL